MVFTHGHVDHVMGIATFEREGRARVVAHEAIAARFERYRLTAGHNAHVNARQFRMPGIAWPTDYRTPDVTYRDHLSLSVGGEPIELHHARGETDDHTWVHLPNRRAVCTGDLFIWATPNCGNPQKVQRHPREWAVALRAMAKLAPALLLPGHGPAIEGEDRVHQALTETATLLEILHDQTLALMNDGAPLDVILGKVRAPPELLARPYLRPVYDEPEFIVRNTYRLYGGWWDGDPAHLKPPREDALANEMASMVGGAERLVERAEQLSRSGDHALACQLVEWAARASPADEGVRRARTLIYRARAATETSLMAKSIFGATEDEPKRPAT